MSSYALAYSSFYCPALRCNLGTDGAAHEGQEAVVEYPVEFNRYNSKILPYV